MPGRIDVSYIPTNPELFDPNARPSRDDVNIAIAAIIAMRGTCRRAKVGAVITLNGRIISTGYNGSIIMNTCEKLGCDINEKCQHAVHAEANAISFAAQNGISLKGATLYCTYAPCYECAKLIYQCGIARVVYEKVYPTDGGKGLELFRKLFLFIEVEQIKSNTESE